MYLAFYRTLLLPIRRLLLPVVMFIARIESLREETPTLYLETVNTDKLASDEDDTTATIAAFLATFRRSVRRRYTHMEQTFKASGLVHEAVPCETALNLSQVVPNMWRHERRQCMADKRNVYEEFVKRFLVVTVVPDGLLDYYYNNDTRELVAVQLSIQQGAVLHWFMYFCNPNQAKSGVWFHGIMLALQRGVVDPTVCYVNAQVHQNESKQNAGLVAAPHTDNDLLAKLYPWSFTRLIPGSTRQLELWKRQ